MKLVLLALRRPITIVVAVIAVALCSWLAMNRMHVDIFPSLGAPAIYVAQPYSGMDPQQMEGFLSYYFEYHFLYITGIEHVESKNIQGAALMKLVFHPGTDMSKAAAQVVGYVNRARAFMPPGAVPPFIVRYDAGSVPVGQLVFSSPIRTPSEMQTMALNDVRPLFATLARCLGASPVRRQSAHHRGPAQSGTAGGLPHLARGSDRRRQSRQRGDARGQCEDR
jgi:multidrug efflux pump subunit AcrB